MRLTDRKPDQLPTVFGGEFVHEQHRDEADRNLPLTDSGAIEKVIAEVMAANPGQLADYRAGKEKLFGFFVGQVMKASGGKANPAQVNDLLKRMLSGS